MTSIIKQGLGLALVCASVGLGVSRADTVQIRTSDIQGTVRWSHTNTYVLNGFVYVEAGEELHIPAGTVVQGNTNDTPQNISCLIVARGGKIFAEGTPQNPVIFTSVLDDVLDPEDLGVTQRGLWGGVVLLGNARINRATSAAGNAATPKYEIYEGLPDAQGTGGQYLHRYGGTDDADSSGVLRYVSIRHGGKVLESNKEINGLSLCGVGSGTVVEYVEAYAIADDGFEFFGGTVNTRHLVSAFNDDDAFDVDMGHRGTHQFWFSIQATDSRDKGGEFNGEPNSPAPDPANPSQPSGSWSIWNWTSIGAGSSSGGANNNALNLRDFASPKIYNSIFTDYAQRGLSIDATSQTHVSSGGLDLANNLWWGFANTNGTVDNSVATVGLNANARAFFENVTKTNHLVDPKLRGISRAADGTLDPRPSSDSPAWSTYQAVPTGAVEVQHAGAFGNDLWINHWTALYQYGLIAPNGGYEEDVVQVANADIVGKVFWHRTNTYVLNGFVYVEAGEELHIEAGTVIKGNTNTTPQNISCLVVARGGKIFAEGTPQNPIIFTSILDDLLDPEDLPLTQRGLWGGVALFGNARINRSTSAAGNAATPKYEVYEGLPDLQGTGGQYLHRYGGTDDADSSGIVKYVSIRHGGKVLESNKEINGLSLCAVGSGTVVENVECYAIADDGFEFFGGTVNTRYLVSAFNDDDAFDIDMGHRGTHQFWFSIQSADSRDKGGEFNGEPNSPAPDPANPSQPAGAWTIWNWTSIGAGAGSGGANNNALNIRDFASPRIYNSIFADYAQRGVGIDNTSQTLVASGSLDLANNLWWGFANTNGVIDNSPGNVALNANARAFFDNPSKTNLIADPGFGGVSRIATGDLDPRTSATGPAYGNAKATPSEAIPAAYIGAFGAVNWASDWSTLGTYRILTGRGAGTPVRASTVVNPTPVVPVIGIVRSGDTLVIRVPSESNFQYTLQSRNRIDSGTWTDEGAAKTGSGSALEFPTGTVTDAKFFRVQVK